MPGRHGSNNGTLLLPGAAIVANSKRSLVAEFEVLAQDILGLLRQVGNQMVDLSKAAAAVTQAIRAGTAACAHHNVSALQLSPTTCPALATVLKVVLHFADNLLFGLPYASARSLLLRCAIDLGVKLKLIPSSAAAAVAGVDAPFPQLGNFAVSQAYYDNPDSEPVRSLAKLEKLMNLLPQSAALAEQDGAFVAPIARGFSEKFSVLSVLFGIPNPSVNHLQSVAKLWDVADDIHFFCQKNRIMVCASTSTRSKTSQSSPPSLSLSSSLPSSRSKVSLTGFKAPYRISTAEVPPMSMSIANEDAETLSGTLGGYVYPKVDPTDPNLSAYSQSAFAMTCAHVCLTETRARRPPVSIPSPVLVNMYREGLLREYSRYALHSEERRAFKRAIAALDADYPRQNGRSVPAKFGEVLWGERVLCHGMISDVAIIRCRQGLKPVANNLGDDVPFAEYDPSLMFRNLTVCNVVKRLTPGLQVFKYGSASKFTTGRLNGPRLIYWADGTLQSSEFVVAASDVGAHAGMFATGGDSGAWILRKHGVSGLGVVGMLHAYDGEHREFGLFTPMTRILERLHEVTGIEWGVVGVKHGGGTNNDGDDDDDEEQEILGGSETSQSSRQDSGLDYSSSSDIDI
ncbi:peptidase S64 [Lipomyces japonicus]|uniref:peptidase S64 n=1 Tax=Lipomyces japonicus TaxID=56871 RepID=UPI0034CE2673